ncbi:MAG: transporter, substrate-binding protein aliphatic sulfonates family [Hyphomicrobiales bacterium]|jgi:NitT/TauT family transport system substrate-binding protein|nr:transporter, substrate-binding protein aliphatic sulfonates family [Hyphomicrobiales bacterium]
MRSSLLALTACLALGTAAHAQTVESPNVKIALDWAFQGPQSVFLYGEELGEFKKEGVSAQIDRGSGSGDTIVRVASGAYQFGWADIATMIKFNSQNPGKELIAVYVTGGASPLAIVTVDGRGIKTPKDLEGRKLGATAGSAALTLFDAFAANAGIDPKKVTWQTMSGQLREPMMVRGDVDAVAGFTSSSIMSVVELGTPLEKVVALRYNDYGVKQYGTAIVVRPDYAEKNPKTVAAVVRAINASFMKAIENPTASTASIKARDPLVNLKNECLRLIDGLQTLTLTDEFKAHGISSVDDTRMVASIEETLKAFAITDKMTQDKVFTKAFLPAQSLRMPPALGSCT